jgi:hypothetical protein
MLLNDVITPSSGGSLEVNQVQTTKGLIDRNLLEVEDIVEEGDNYRSIATEWRLNGELVKRDGHVIILRGQALMGEAEKI